MKYLLVAAFVVAAIVVSYLAIMLLVAVGKRLLR